MTPTPSSLARRLALGLATGTVAAALSGCMALAALTSVPAEIRTLVNPEHVWVETRIELGPNAVARSITECENDTTFDAGHGTRTQSKPVNKDASAAIRYAVYSVDSVNYVVGHRQVCWDGAASPAPFQARVGVLEKATGGWIIRDPIKTPTAPSADKKFTRWSSSSKHNASPAPRGDEVAPNAELTALVTNAVASHTVIAPPTVVLEGVAPMKENLPKVEFAVNLRGAPDVRCSGQYDCYFQASLFSRVSPPVYYPATLHANGWQIDLSVPPSVRVLYLQESKELLQRPLELSGVEVDLKGLFDKRPTWSSIQGRDNFKGYYFNLQRSQTTWPLLSY